MRPRHLLASAAVLLAANVAVAIAQRPDAFGESREHPAIGYNTGATSTVVDEMNAKLADGRVRFAFDPVSGYLRSAVEAFGLAVESQVLVYTGTSLQAPKINPTNPRAFYFNDVVTVGWVRGGTVLEVSVQDPRQGTQFYTLDQAVEGGTLRFRREMGCLSCHLSWDTLAVPGRMVLTTFPRKTDRDYANGHTVDHRVPVEERWGGWYVTGKQVPSRHMGNLPLFMDVPAKPSSLQASKPSSLQASKPANLPSVDGLFDLSGYLTNTSDVVALMVLDHQLHVNNLITRVAWEARVGNAARVGDGARDLVDYLLFVDEAPIDEPIVGGSGFAEKFAALGPKDSQGRSPRDLKLDGRMMQYPLSYMIYTPAYDAMPAMAKEAVAARLRQVLAGEDASAKYAHLTPEVRQALLEILKDTKPGL